MPLAVLLSVCIGVAGCGCHNSSHVTRSGSNCRAFIYKALISASAADDITPLIIFAIIDMGPLIICLLLILFPKYVYPAARDHAPVATKYAASE